MDKNKIVEINGRKYDSKTGLLLAQTTTNKATQPAKSRPVSAHSQSIHSQPKKSKTLNRQAISKPQSAKKPVNKGQVMDFAPKNSNKFAPHPIKQENPKTEPVKPKQTIKPSEKMHPLTAKVQLSAANFDSKPKAPAQQTPVKVSSKKPKVKKISFGLIISIAVVIILFLAYYFVPEISLRIASFQTGIDPSYPSYTPANFRSNGPVSSSNGIVKIDFVGNENQTYTITQEKSTWDSSALLENVVKPAIGQSYITNQYSGITIYSYNNTSTWVNAGKIFKLNSSSPLKSEDVRRIAISM